MDCAGWDPAPRNSVRTSIRLSDYEQSFRVLHTLQRDVFLGPHPMFFQLDAKRQRMRTGAPNPFVDPGELRRFVDESERRFRAELKRQQTER